MRKIITFFIVSMLLLLAGCQDTYNTVIVASLAGTKDSVEDFLHLQGEFTSVYDSDTCFNVTPTDIADNSEFRVFKYSQSCASFLLYDNQILPIGEWFGGLGVVNMKLADLNKDGSQELYITYSWGSGIHRSQIGYFDANDKEMHIFNFTNLNSDMMLSDNKSGGLSLYNAAVQIGADFTDLEIEALNHIADIVFENNEIKLLESE